MIIPSNIYLGLYTAAAKKDVRYYLNAINFDQENNRLVATDDEKINYYVMPVRF